MTGRALDMELLQLLAMHKFAEAAEGASGAVLKFIVEDIYSMEPPKDEYGNWFGLAGFDDFRPSMIIPAVVNYIRRNQPSFDWLRAFVFGGSAYMVTTAQKVGHAPEDEFRELREWCPEFNEDLAMGLQMAAMGQYGPNV